METALGNHESKALNLWNRASFRTSFRLLILIVTLTGLTAPVHASEADDSPGITVLVFNFRNVPIHTLIVAQSEAGRIFENAGVRVTWRECPTENQPCHKGPGRVVILAIKSDPVQDRWRETIAGSALVPEHLAIVYYDYLPRVPRETSGEYETARIMGCVIAHELGHLLMATEKHSVAGIMQAQWDEEQTMRALRSQLFFQRGEAKLMQSAAQGGTQEIRELAKSSR